VDRRSHILAQSLEASNIRCRNAIRARLQIRAKYQFPSIKMTIRRIYAINRQLIEQLFIPVEFSTPEFIEQLPKASFN
jgi:hypothetical protein